MSIIYNHIQYLQLFVHYLWPYASSVLNQQKIIP